MNIYPDVLSTYSDIVNKLIEGYSVYVITPSTRKEDHNYVMGRIYSCLKDRGINRKLVFISDHYPQDRSVVLYFFPDTNRNASLLLRNDR